MAAPTVGKWIAETNQERRRLEALLGRTPTTRLIADDVKALVASQQDITAPLAAADPADKAKVYPEMGIDITYRQDGRVVVESRAACRRVWCRRSVRDAGYKESNAGDIVLDCIGRSLPCEGLSGVAAIWTNRRKRTLTWGCAMY